MMRDSVDDIARRSRGAAKAPVEGRDALIYEKSTISCQAGWPVVLFFRKIDKPGSRFQWVTRDRGFGVKGRERLGNGAANR
jgi:hypothetical protein